MKLRNFRLIIFLVTMLVHFGWAQQRDLDSLIQKFDQYRQHALQEKLYVHMDRNFFLTGETLWFKIYAVDGTFHKPLAISKVAYMEVLDKNKVAVLQAKVELKDGSGNGSVFLPATLPSGNYLIRFYTHWMRNFNPEFYFQKPLTIVNTFVRAETEPRLNSDAYHVEFFPEGGNLVAGIESRIAFKVTDRYGNGVSAKCFVTDQNTDTLVTFKTLKFGIGTFYFTPRVDGKYTVIVDSNGKKSTPALPKIYESGYVMRLDNTNTENISVTVTAHDKIESNNPFVYLFIHTRQQIIKAEVKFLQQGAATFIISKSELGEGISHFTLLNAQRQPVCERLYFKQPDKNLNITIKSEQPEYGARRKVKLNVEASIPNQNPASSNLSVSVYKIDSLNTISSDNIFSYLWLSSDLNGTVESPEFYQSNDSDVQEATDNLMLTHGWRRFHWEDILQRKKTIRFIPEYRGHIIKGRVYDPDGNPKPGILTYLSSPGKNIRLYGSRSNAKGEVLYDVKDFRGPGRIVVQTNTMLDTIHNIQIESPFSDKFSNFTLPSFKLSSTIRQHLLSRSIAMQVQDIYYGEESTRVSAPAADSLAFYGKADETYFLDDYTRFPVMEEVMREYVPGVMVRKRRDGFHFVVLDHVNRGVLPENPMVLLDGVPVFDINKIMAYDPLKVKKLEVVTRRYYVGPLFLPGIVSYSTYQGDLNGFELDPRAVSLNYEGLQLQREFYAPKYDTPKQRNNRMPDQRTLLFWSPNVNTDKNGMHQLEFFTSDVTGNYQVVVEGLTSDGFSGSASHTFSVKRFDY